MPRTLKDRTVHLIKEFERIRGDISTGELRQLYCFSGPECYFADRLIEHLLEDVVPKDCRTFDQEVLNGDQEDSISIGSSLERAPRVAKRRLIVVRTANRIAEPERLAKVLERIQTENVLALDLGPKFEPGRSPKDPWKRILKVAQTRGEDFLSRELYESETSSYIPTMAREMGLTVDRRTAQLLVYKLGTNLQLIRNELVKVSLLIEKDVTTITEKDVEQYIGEAKDFSAYQLIDEIGRKNAVEANRIAKQITKNNKEGDFGSLIPKLFTYFQNVFAIGYSKVCHDGSMDGFLHELAIPPSMNPKYAQASILYPPRRCFEIFGLLREFDMRNKGLIGRDLNKENALYELIYRIIN